MVAMGEPDPCREPHPRESRYTPFFLFSSGAKRFTSYNISTQRFTYQFSIVSVLLLSRLYVLIESNKIRISCN